MHSWILKLRNRLTGVSSILPVMDRMDRQLYETLSALEQLKPALFDIERKLIDIQSTAVSEKKESHGQMRTLRAIVEELHGLIRNSPSQALLTLDQIKPKLTAIQDIISENHVIAMSDKAQNQIQAQHIIGLLQDLANSLAPETWVPPGHFYSPIVDVKELASRRDLIFDRSLQDLGIDMNDSEQCQWLNRFSRHKDQIDFPERQTEGFRFFYQNKVFAYSDAAVLCAMMLELKPKRIIEVGSGFSSAVIMDTNDRFFNGDIQCTFIEPHPDTLYYLMTEQDLEDYRVYQKPLQSVDLDLFESLEENDILFIDSTHVSKCGSDVNHHLFEVLPRLKSGVVLHFHDIFYPFEYPEEWFFVENKSWNELYILRAFLHNNPDYKIIYFNDYMGIFHQGLIEKSLPVCLKNTGGSLWLQKS